MKIVLYLTDKFKFSILITYIKHKNLHRWLGTNHRLSNHNGKNFWDPNPNLLPLHPHPQPLIFKH